MEWIDLRSDTVTHPTKAMRKAMANAEVGDDVFGEDPSVNKLQMMAAEKMGKEAGLFVPSGTMGNLAAVLAHCGRGDEVILGNKAHTFLYEAGGISALGGVHSCQLPNQADGTLVLEDIQAAIRSKDAHQPISRLVCLENTHNRCGGVAITADYTRAVGELAHQNGLLLHLDGARIFNAAAGLGVPAIELAQPAELGHILPQQGVMRAGRQRVMRQSGIYCQGTPHPQTARRWNAAGRDFSCSRNRGVGNDGGPASR